MKKCLKRSTGIFLCFAMIFGNFPANMRGEDSGEENGKYLPTDQSITISAEAENTITVKETEDDEQDKPVEKCRRDTDASGRR